MTPLVAVPVAMAVRAVLAALLDRPVEVSPGDPVVVGRIEGTVGAYVDDRLHLAAAASLDLPLSLAVGAALGLLPAATRLDAELRENVAEVLNVLCVALVGEDGPHLRLYAVSPPDALPPSDVLLLTRSLHRRLDLAVMVAGYGEGGLSIVVA